MSISYLGSESTAEGEYSIRVKSEDEDEEESYHTPYTCWGIDREESSEVTAPSKRRVKTKPALRVEPREQRSTTWLDAGDARDEVPSTPYTEDVVEQGKDNNRDSQDDDDDDDSIALSLQGVYTDNENILEKKSFTDFASPEDEELQMCSSLTKYRKLVRRRVAIIVAVILLLLILLLSTLLAKKGRDHRSAASARGDVAPELAPTTTSATPEADTSTTATTLPTATTTTLPTTPAKKGKGGKTEATPKPPKSEEIVPESTQGTTEATTPLEPVAQQSKPVCISSVLFVIIMARKFLYIYHLLSWQNRNVTKKHYS